MKRILCMALTVFAAAMLLASCSSRETNITVKIVVDEGFDGKYEETLFEESIGVPGDEPNIDSVITALDNEEKATVEFEQDEDGNMKLKSIDGKENKEDGSMIYEWMAKVNGDDVKGLWKEYKVKDGDTVVFIYGIWEPSAK